MPVPKKRHSNVRQGKRRFANFRFKSGPTLSKCANCGAPTLPHQVCRSCGYYRGRQVVKIKVKKQKGKKE